MESKQCYFCKEIKSLDEFYVLQQRKTLSNGEVKVYEYKQSGCIECLKAGKSYNQTKKLLIDRLIDFAKSKGYKHLSHARDVIGLNKLKQMYYEENN